MVAPSIDRDSAVWRRDTVWAVWAVVAAFGTYFCMYGFRKPFTAATFAEASVFGITLKTLLVTSQVIGYMLSKFIGIKVIAEMPPKGRALGIVILVTCAEAALVVFALAPPPWNALAMFANGLALGMVFGLVLGFLEGRRVTEALTAGLCASFILAGGVMKSVGAWLLASGVSESWMPCVAGLVFVGPLLIGTWMLSCIPAPSASDVAARAARQRMTRAERWDLLGRYAIGLTAIVMIYFVISILRGVRDDFAPEIWTGLGQPAEPETFSYSEILVALSVMAINGCAVFIADNRRAFFTALATCGLGFLLIAAALLGRQTDSLDAFSFMVLVGIGLYLPYVAIHTTVFERLLAMTRERGNLGFLMYVADSVGYLGYVVVLLLRETLTSVDGFLPFFLLTCWLTCVISLACLALGWRYFAIRCATPALAPVPEGVV